MTDKQIIIDGVDVKLFRTPLEVIDYLKQDAVRVVTKELFEQLIRKEQECERLKEIIKHLDHNRMQKANKLKRIEEIIIACKSGYTDEFIQSILAIVLEAEPIKE